MLIADSALASSDARRREQDSPARRASELSLVDSGITLVYKFCLKRINENDLTRGGAADARLLCSLHLPARFCIAERCVMRVRIIASSSYSSIHWKILARMRAQTQVVLWMTPRGPPKASRASNCGELPDFTGAAYLIAAQRQLGTVTSRTGRSFRRTLPNLQP